MPDRKFSFEPVYGKDAKVLILGSMPSVISLQESFYYAHPRNAFWPMMFELLNEEYRDGIEEKKALLLRNKLALWDVAASCIREGSLDSAIRDALPNDIPRLLQACPHIHRILFNGTTAFALYKRLIEPPKITYAVMPSTSPANTIGYAKKCRAWAAYIPERKEMR